MNIFFLIILFPNVLLSEIGNSGNEYLVTETETRKIFKIGREWNYNIIFKNAGGNIIDSGTVKLVVVNLPPIMGQYHVEYQLTFSGQKTLRHPELVEENYLGKGGLIRGFKNTTISIEEMDSFTLGLVDSLHKAFQDNLDNPGLHIPESMLSHIPADSIHLITLKPPRADKLLFTQYAPFPYINLKQFNPELKKGAIISSSTKRIMHPSLLPAISNNTYLFRGFQDLQLPYGMIENVISIEGIAEVEFSTPEKERYKTIFHYDDYFGFCRIEWIKPDNSSVILELVSVNF